MGTPDLENSKALAAVSVRTSFAGSKTKNKHLQTSLTKSPAVRNPTERMGSLQYIRLCASVHDSNLRDSHPPTVQFSVLDLIHSGE